MRSHSNKNMNELTYCDVEKCINKKICCVGETVDTPLAIRYHISFDKN